jgi:CRP/FNR family cyclic AMP-dependent transcriptional regulator
MSASVDVLRAVPLFRELSTRDLRGLAASMSEKSYATGDVVVAEGQRGIGFFVILEGYATVSQGGEDRARLGPGDYFGEMALIDGEDRVATVVASGDLRCAAMTMWNFRPFVREHPDVAWSLLTALVKRVRESRARDAVAAG